MNKYEVSKVALLILLLLLAVYVVIINKHMQMQSDYDALYTKTFYLNFADEVFLRDVTNKANSEKVNQDINNLRDALGDYVIQTYLMGKELSPTTFCQIYAYDKWNNDIQAAGGHQTTNQMISQDKLYDWKVNLLSASNADSQSHQGFITTLRDMFSNRSLNKYHSNICTDN